MTTNLPTAPGLGRRVVASLWAAAAMPYLVLSLWVPAARALGFFKSVPIPVVVVLSTLAGPALLASRPRLAARLPESLDRWLDPPNRKLLLLWAAGGLFALFSLGRMAVFLGDPAYVSCSLDPADPFLLRHSCLTAYVHGAILSTVPGANVYDVAFVEGVSNALTAPLPPTAAHFAPFTLDAFGYPPPFLLLPRALILLTTDFSSQRLLFAAASFLLTLFACARAATTLGGVAERRMWLLTPIFLAAPEVLATLQVGNFHLAAMAICLLCWVSLERRRDGLGGALLAVATLAKIFPGVLGILILVRRQWRAVGFTVVAAAALGALSVAVLGTKVWSDFLFYHLPKVQSGEALRFLAETRMNIDFNVAPFGIPFKLGALGLEGWGWPEARLFGSVYTVIVMVLAVLAGRNGGSPRHRLTVWLAIAMLASLRSPYAAPFVLVTVILMLLPMAAEARSRWTVAAFVGAWLVFLLPWPLPNRPQVTTAASLVRVCASYVFLVWAVLRRDPGVDGGEGDAAAGPGSTAARALPGA
jgi:alpha-1,2-mannosyltransferase